MPTSPSLDLTALLAPIAGSNPAGVDLRRDTLFDDLRKRRRAIADAAAPVAELDKDSGYQPAHSGTVDDHVRFVEQTTASALAGRSKDLLLAVWLLEARTRSAAFAGAAEGLELVRLLIESYWDTLHPEPDPEDDDPLAARTAVVEWIEKGLPELLKTFPLRPDNPFSSLGHFAIVQSTTDREKKKSLVEAGWPTIEDFPIILSGSDPDDLRLLSEQMAACLEQVQALEQVTDTRFVIRRKLASGVEREDRLVSFRALREVLETGTRLLGRAIPDEDERAEPDVAGEPAADLPFEEPAAGVPSEAAVEDVRSTGVTRVRATTTAANSPEEALARLRSAAEFLWTTNATDPTPYLVGRAIAFGPLLAHDDLSAALPLPSPPTGVRQRLRALAGDGQWEDLLREAEQFLRASPNQPWLDLQRYIVTALERIGGAHQRVGTALLQFLRIVLEAMPDLVDAEFSDGTPVANPETLRWLRESAIVERAAPVALHPPPPPPADVREHAPRPEEGAAPTAVEQAMALVRGKRVSEALRLLQDLVTNAPSGRTRFLRRLDLAEVCLEAGNPALAFPILDELAATIEQARLEEWEDRGLIVRAWSALVRCCRQLGENTAAHSRGAEIFDRLCRLDISTALGLETGVGSDAARRFRH
jgi:type VI secretion system protein ImpA